MPLYRYVASETASDSSTSSSENEPFSDDEEARDRRADTSRSRLPDAPRVGHSQLRYHYLPHITQPYPVTSRKTLRLRAAILDAILALLGIVAELNEDDASGAYRVRHAKRYQKPVRRGRRVQVKKSHATGEAWYALPAALSDLATTIKSQGRVPEDGPSRTCLALLLALFRSVRTELESAARENRFQRAQWVTSTSSINDITALVLAAAVSTSAPARHVDVVLGTPAVIACRVAAFALVDRDTFNHTLDLSSLPRLPEAVDWNGLFAAFGSSPATVYHINASGGSFEHWPDWQPWPFPTLRSIDLPETSLKSLPLRIAWRATSVRLPQRSKPMDNSWLLQDVNSTYLRLREPPVSRAHRSADRPTTHRLGPLSLLDIATEMIISRKSLFSEALADLDTGSCSAFDVVSRGYVCCACGALCRPDVRGTAARWIEGEYGLILHADMEDHIAPGLPAHDLELRGRLCSDCRDDEIDLVGPLPPRVSDQIEMPCKQQT